MLNTAKDVIELCAANIALRAETDGIIARANEKPGNRGYMVPNRFFPVFDPIQDHARLTNLRYELQLQGLK